MFTVLPKKNKDIEGFHHKYPNINVTCSSKSFQANDTQCYQAFLLDNSHIHFCSDASSDQWFEFSFPNIYVKLLYYSIQGPNNETKDYWDAPKSWNFYGYTKDDSEELIDYVELSGITGNYQVETFKITSSNLFKSFKLMMIGKNYGDITTELRIHKIDLFGFFYPTICRCTFQDDHKYLLICFYIFVII